MNEYNTTNSNNANPFFLTKFQSNISFWEI